MAKMIFVGKELEGGIHCCTFALSQMGEDFAQFLEGASLVVLGQDLAQQLNVTKDVPTSKMGQLGQLPGLRRVPAGLGSALHRPIPVDPALGGLLVEKDTAVCSGLFPNLDTFGRELEGLLVKG